MANTMHNSTSGNEEKDKMSPAVTVRTVSKKDKLIKEDPGDHIILEMTGISENKMKFLDKIK